MCIVVADKFHPQWGKHSGYSPTQFDYRIALQVQVLTSDSYIKEKTVLFCYFKKYKAI